MKAYILDVLRIPGGVWMDLGMDYEYTFSFTRSGITEIKIKDDFLRAIVSGLFPFWCIRMARRYGEGMTTTIMYIIQLFIHKKTRLSTKLKIKCIISDYCYLLWPESAGIWH